jgi:hypothetical protein
VSRRPPHRICCQHFRRTAPGGYITRPRCLPGRK